MAKVQSFKIFCPSTGLGLKKDAKIIETTLRELGFQVSVYTGQRFYRVISFLYIKVRLVKLSLRIKRFFNRDSNVVVIHLERVSQKGLLVGGHNILVPNQEWCAKHVLSLLSYIDVIWCKSKLAVAIFSELGYSTEYISFCTELDSSVMRNEVLINQEKGFFTRIGPSRNRGAEQLAKLWAKHSEWPILKMVVDPEYRPDTIAENIEYIGYIHSDEEFNCLANSVPFHIFLTEAEGFGHLIVESMSRGAIVLMTNASPMNEYASQESAILMSAYYAGQLQLSPRFHVNDDVIEAAVEKALSLNSEAKFTISKMAANINGELIQKFREHLVHAISRL